MATNKPVGGDWLALLVVVALVVVGLSLEGWGVLGVWAVFVAGGIFVHEVFWLLVIFFPVLWVVVWSIQSA